MSTLPAVGAIWPSESSTVPDRLSGAMVTRLTRYRGHSTHLYFTENGFWDSGRQLLFSSDRGGVWNLFSCRLDSGELVQLTAQPPGQDLDPFGSLDLAHERYLTWCGPELVAIDLRRARQETVYRAPDGWDRGLIGCEAGGGGIWFALAQAAGLDRSWAYLNYREAFALSRCSRVIRVDCARGAAQVVHEANAWITHVNPSPVHAGLVTFCHEGPWDRVQRMWLIDGTAVGPLRPSDGTWGVGHEFWCADGATIGYHARHGGDARRHLLGFIARDGAIVHEAEIALPTQHAHANSPDLAVLDGTRATGERLLLVQRAADGWEAPRLLCCHDTSRHHHTSHAHPRFAPDGRSVVFASDRGGYTDIYRVVLPDDLGALPLAAAHPVERFYWM